MKVNHLLWGSALILKFKFTPRQNYGIETIIVNTRIDFNVNSTSPIQLYRQALADHRLFSIFLSFFSLMILI